MSDRSRSEFCYVATSVQSSYGNGREFGISKKAVTNSFKRTEGRLRKDYPTIIATSGYFYPENELYIRTPWASQEVIRRAGGTLLINTLSESTFWMIHRLTVIGKDKITIKGLIAALTFVGPRTEGEFATAGSRVRREPTIVHVAIDELDAIVTSQNRIWLREMLDGNCPVLLR